MYIYNRYEGETYKKELGGNNHPTLRIIYHQFFEIASIEIIYNKNSLHIHAYRAIP